MKKQLQKLSSILLTLVMLLSLLPTTALAADTYTVTVNGGTASPAGPYTVDTEVTVTADPDPEGKKFKEWQIEGLSTTTSESRSIFFYMPANNVTITAIYEDANIIIESASATITEPVAGANPDFNIVSADESKYTVTVVKWNLLDGSSYPVLTADDKFERGESYQLDVKFVANPGYEFSDSCVYNVNGVPRAAYSLTKGERRCYFDVYEIIDTINVKGVVAPVAGATPDVSGITSDTDGINVIDVKWRDKDGYAFEGNPFVAGEKYILWLKYETESDYKVADDAEVTFNISDINILDKEITHPIIKMTYEVPADTTYTVSFDVKLYDNSNTKESSIFSGYDGRIQIAGHEGHLSADVNYFTRDFGYTVPTDGTEVEITIVGTFQGTKVYVDGQLVSFLSQKQDQDGLSGVSTVYSSVLLPLEKIGQDFHGSLADIRVYNKAFSAEEVKDAYNGIDDGKVNVAQNAYAGSDSYRPGDAFDDSEQRTRTSAKAIDGDGFTVKADRTAQPDTATSDIYSYWRGDHSDSALTIDLGEAREISEIGIQWRYGGKGKDFDILTSMDGEQWTTAKQVRGNGDFFQTIALEEAVNARYVKMQGIASNASVYMIQEFMVYETVDKTALAALLEEAQDLTSEDAEHAVIFARAMQENPLATAKEVCAAVEALETALEEAVPVNPFDDVDPVHHAAFYDAILWANASGVTTGIDANHFNPKGACQRASVVTFLWRAADCPEPITTENPFEDVTEKDFYYKAVLWAYENKITTGTSADQFSPMKECNRAEVVTFLWRAMGSPDSAAEVSFVDVQPGQFYSTAVAWAVEKGITNGMGDGNFGINTTCNRAQVVTFLYRTLAK